MVSGASAKKKVPIKQGLFAIPSSPGEKGHLIGSKCKACGEYFYPKRHVCLNCYSQDLEEVALSTRGEIMTYTIARVAPPGAPFQPPYVIAQVQLPEGVVFQTVLLGVGPDKVKIGAGVQVSVEKVKEDQEGNEVMAFVLRPV